MGSPEYFEFVERDEKQNHCVQDEIDLRKRIKKRQNKLVFATEEAFNKLINLSV